MSRRLLGIALALVLVTSSSVAWATPLGSKRDQAKSVKAQIDTLDGKMEIAVEDYNEASSKYHSLNRQVSVISARLRKIRKRTDVLQRALNTRAVHMYRTGPLGVVDVLLGTASFEDFAATWDFLNQMNEREAGMVSELKVSRSKAATTKASLVKTRAEARAVYQDMRARKRSIESQLGERRSKLAGLGKEIEALEAEQRRAALASLGSGGGWDYGDPTNAPRSGVVAIAMGLRDKPYRYGAAGPNAFDCSGFTMYVYAQVGVHLPHSSRAQISCGQRVSRANLAPGDLVFFYNPIHHVGIYVGGGQFIHAPHTGAVVQVDSLAAHGGYVGACRP